MANTWYLGGSPLGLFNVYSRPTPDGMATFNAGKTRNVNVLAYNTGRKQQTNIKGKSGNLLQSPISLFAGGMLPNFWPNIGKLGTDQDIGGVGDNGTTTYKGLTRNTLHNNDVYDISILNIIEKLSSCPSATIRPQDFAYLRYLGVYPNNRLMIARRFGSPMPDNIMTKWGVSPKAVLVSWKPDNEDFLQFSFGEEWVPAEADFTDILNKLGENFGVSNLGSGLDESMNVLPLPGFTETIRRKVLESMGILAPGAGSDPLPSGNPNIIKEAKRRKTVGYGEAASGLKFKISIKMICEYEQKFISGIDPTIAFMDILNNILVFGTSNSDNYGLSKKFSKKIEAYANDPSLLITDMINGIKAGFEAIIVEVEKAIETAIGAIDRTDPDAAGPDPKPAPGEEEEASIRDAGSKIKEGIEKAIGEISKSIRATTEKYKIELIGVANALSGAPSTPWHITLGNPLRPVFCAGDMYTDDLTLTLGPHLAFNDLPVTFRVEFTLTNARPLGLQEILSKFNTGHLRTVNIRKDSTEFLGQIGKAPYFNIVDESELLNTGLSRSVSASGALSDQIKPADPNTGSGTASNSTKEGGNNAVINSNPNSTLPASS